MIIEEKSVKYQEIVLDEVFADACLELLKPEDRYRVKCVKFIRWVFSYDLKLAKGVMECFQMRWHSTGNTQYGRAHLDRKTNESGMSRYVLRIYEE